MHTDSALPTHPFLRDPRTFEPIRALFRTKTGRLVWPVMGASPDDPSNANVPPAGTDAGQQTPAQPAAAPTATPTVQAPTPAPAQPVIANGPNGYPENTPLAQMTSEQREAYWKYHSRKHEEQVKAQSTELEQLRAKAAELDQLKQSMMTEQERALAAAREEGRRQALEEAGGQLVEAHLRAAIGDRKTVDEVNALLAGIDRKQFLTADGLKVDTDKVHAFVAVVAPAVPAVPAQPSTPAQQTASAAPAASGGAAQQSQPVTGGQAKPDMGQGKPTIAKPSGMEAGRQKARELFPHLFQAQSQ